MKPTPTVWKYRLNAPFIWKPSIQPNFQNWQTNMVFFTDEKDRLRLSIGIDGTITVEEDYAWDGCSPKWRVGSYLPGVPDGAPNPDTGYPYTYFGSLIHDALLQWEDDPHMPYTREEIDLIFLERLMLDKFSDADTYYKFVRMYSRWVGFKRGVQSLRICL